MDKLWLEWGMPLLYLALNIACLVVLLRLCAWLAAAGLRRWSGVDVSCKGMWPGSVREIRIKWRGGEVGVCGLRLGLRCFTRSARRLLKVDVDQVYCVGFPKGDLTPSPDGRGHGRGAGGRASSIRRVATAVVLRLSKRLATCTDIAVSSVLLDVPCPWVGVNGCAVGVSLKGCRITGARLPRGEGLHMAAQVDKGLARVATEESEPTAAGRDLLSVVFAGELVLHLDLRSTRPVRLLQVGVVPAGAYLFEDCLEVIRESRGGGAPRPSMDYSCVIGKLSALLPLTTEVMLEEGTLQYLRHDNKKLAVKFSRFLCSAKPCSPCDGVAMDTHIHNLRLFTSSSEPVSSISLLHHSAELRVERVTQSCSVTSLRGTIKDGGVVHWVRHFAALVPGPAPVGHTHPPDGGRQIAHQDQSVDKGGSVAMAITVEANDWQLECHLDQQSLQSSVCHLLVASVVGSVQSEWDSGRRMIKNTLRLEDVYLSVSSGGQHGAQQGGELAAVLPSSSRHVWGRMVAMGTCFAEVRTSYPGECPEGNIKGCPLAPLAVECNVSCGILEWSRATSRVISAVVSHMQGHYGLTAPQKGGWGSGRGLLEAARCGSFELRVANLNCIVADECGAARTLLLVHADVFRAANQPGGNREVCGGAWWECEALQAGQAGVSGLTVCAEVFEGLEKVFPCLLMSDLPPGVLEVPQFSVELERRDTINVVTHVSECVVNWTPTLHCTAKHVLDAVVDSVQALLVNEPPQQGTAPPSEPQQGTAPPSEPQQGTAPPNEPQQGTAPPNEPPQQGTAPPNEPQQGTAPHSDSSRAPSVDDSPSPLPLSRYLSKLSGLCVSVGVIKASVNITVNTVHKVSCVVSGGDLSLSGQQCAVSAKQVEAVLDKNRIVLISDISGRLLDDNDPLTWSRSDFAQLSLPSNTSIELVACQVQVTFPHDYFFAETFEKLQAARKFLVHTHKRDEGGGGGAERAALGGLVPPDVYLRAESFSFQLQDNMFEASLKSNHMLLTDVRSQRMEFVKALQSKISQIEQEQGKISAKKKQALYESLEAQVYCDKAKVYYSDDPPSQKLFEVFLQQPRLALLADTSMLGRSSLVQQMRDIDRQAPFPTNTNFSTLRGCYIKGGASQFQLLLRDYPQPLLSQSDVSVRGRSVLAEEEAIERATRNIVIRVDPPWSSVVTVKKMAALKLFHDWDWNCKVSIGCWGSCYEPVLAQVNFAFEKVVKRSIDPSKPLPFWDKMRAVLHGSFRMTAEHAQLLLLSTRDPYNMTEYLDCQSTDLSLQYDTGVLELSGAMDVFIHTASKYDESQLLHVPKAVFRSNFKWVCPDDPNAHHGMMPCVPDKVPALEDNQVHDSFVRFRSQCLNLQLSLNVEPGGEGDTRPTLVLYASTLRWLQQFQSVLFRVISLPIRRGSVHGNVRPKQQRFSRHLRDVDISVSCGNGEVCYWGSASQQSGVHGSFKQAEASLSYSLDLVPFEDGLVRRPQADWHITSCRGAGEGMEVQLYHLAEVRRVKGADFLHHLRLDDTAKQHLLNMGRVQYTRLNEQPDHLSPELRVPVEYRHQLQTLDTRVSWTSLSRTILSGLFDAHRKSQAVKNNLLSDALKPAKHLDLPSKNVASVSGVSESSPPRTSEGDSPGGRHGDGHDYRHRSPSLLAQLISDVTRRIVEHTDESGRSTEPRLKGKEACSLDDVEQQNWLIQLENTQLAFQGVESRGCVLVSATLAHATNHTHSPKLSNSGDILVKTSWVARVEDMQYFATVDPEVCVSANNMPWISTSRVMGQPVKVAMATDHTQPREADDINALLLGTLGPQDSATNVRDPLIGGVSSGGEGVGGLVTSTAHLGNGEAMQLQRIASRCYCQIFYVTYSQEEEHGGHLAPKTSPAKEDQPCVDTFTIRHPSVHISTTSSQYAMLLDIVNNLLLYKEPRQKELTEIMKRLRFTLQLSNIEDCRTPILARQERVRQLLGSIRSLERDISLAVKSTDSPSESVDELHDRLSELKAQLHQVGQELDVLIKLYKENQFFLPPSTAQSQSKKPHPVRCIEVWLDDAHWWLTESDGQIELADVTLANCCYVRNSFSDDSGEHRFELQNCSVQNLSPTAAYQEVLVPYDRDWRVDKNVRLRVYCRDKAPVAGISVKDHFEVNVVPLKVQLTQQFYGRMFEFFFPSRAANEEGPQDSEMALLIVGTQPQASGEGQPEGAGEGGGDKSKRKKAALDSQRRKVSAMELSDVERMRERALQIKTFLYIKITPVPLLISYHGKQGGIPIDIDNFKVSIPTLEYHSRNWTWKDLFMAIKRDCKQAIVPKAIKTKLGMESRSEHRQGLVLGREAAGPLDMQLLWSGSQRASKRSKSKGSKEPELK